MSGQPERGGVQVLCQHGVQAADALSVVIGAHQRQANPDDGRARLARGAGDAQGARSVGFIPLGRAKAFAAAAFKKIPRVVRAQKKRRPAACVMGMVKS